MMMIEFYSDFYDSQLFLSCYTHYSERKRELDSMEVIRQR